MIVPDEYVRRDKYHNISAIPFPVLKRLFSGRRWRIPEARGENARLAFATGAGRVASKAKKPRAALVPALAEE
jgi:hypothetical protein